MQTELRLSGKDHRLNNINVNPMSLQMRDELAIRVVMAWHERGVVSFPKQVNSNWSFGWTLFVLWVYRCRLAKAGANVTEIALFEMLHGIVDDNLLPFGIAPEKREPKQLELEFGVEEEIVPVSEDLGVFMKDGQPVVSSRMVAAIFAKRHCDVLRDIKRLDCSAGFNERNFASVEYEDKKGEKRQEIHMTRDGFTFLCMGYTGKKAAQYKEAYINRFNEMEAELRNPQAQEVPALPSPKSTTSKKFYWPEEAAKELGLVGYRVLYREMEALGIVNHRGRLYVPAPKYEKYVKMRTLYTKNGDRYERPVITPAGMIYLREKLAA